MPPPVCNEFDKEFEYIDEAAKVDDQMEREKEEKYRLSEFAKIEHEKNIIKDNVSEMPDQLETLDW